MSVTCAFEFKRAEHLPEGGVIHRGDMDTTPLANAPGNMPPESLQRRINLLCGDVVPQVALMTAGLCKFTQILQLPQNTKGGIARC